MAVDLPDYLDPDVAAAAEKRLAEAKDIADKKAKANVKLGAQGVALVGSGIASGFNPATMYLATKKAGEVAENVTGALRGVEGDAGKLGASVATGLLPDKALFGEDDEEDDK
jgi:hypothetical protein